MPVSPAGMEAHAVRNPTEAVTDPFKLARQLRPKFPFSFTQENGWSAPESAVRATLALQLKAAFDRDRLLDRDHRVMRVTAALVEDVMLALAALQSVAS